MADRRLGDAVLYGTQKSDSKSLASYRGMV